MIYSIFVNKHYAGHEFLICCDNSVLRYNKFIALASFLFFVCICTEESSICPLHRILYRQGTHEVGATYIDSNK